MNTPEITVKFVEEQGFSPEVVSIFTRTSAAATMLKELIAEREAARLARKIARERQLLSLSC